MITCPDCSSTYGGGERGGHCMSCHQTFTNDETGDKHRVGPYNPSGLRRCLTVAEMEAEGWRSTPRGWTHNRAMPREAWAARHRSPEPHDPSLDTKEVPDGF